MASQPVEDLVQQIRKLPQEQQLELAEAVDRLTWAQRWRLICESVERRSAGRDSITDEQIDELVDQVRRETPLSARSSTHRS